MKSWSRLDGLVLALLALLVILFYWRILTPTLADRQSFPPGDFHAQFWAFATFEVRELSAGRLPLWNPYTFAGAPFWADVQSAVFYPPSLLTVLLSAPWGFSLFALELEAIAHFWLAALFMYLFSRALTQSRSAGFIAALTFTFSGYLTGYPSQQLAVLESNVWLPLILFFLFQSVDRGQAGKQEGTEAEAQRRREEEDQKVSLSSPNTDYSPSPPALQPFGFAQERPSEPSTHQSFDFAQDKPSSLPTFQPSLPPLLLAGVAWGLTLLAGHPQSALITAYVSMAYFFFLGWITNRQESSQRPGRRNVWHPPRYALQAAFQALGQSFLFLFTGLGIAAIQFIPAVEYTLLSVRAEGTYEAMSGGLPITDLVQLLLPGQVSLYSPLYIGVVGLTLVLWVIFAAPTRHTAFWALTAGLALLISLGGNTFFYSALYLSSPGFAIFRGQERWAFVVAFSLSVLVGYGVRAVLHSVRSKAAEEPRSGEAEAQKRGGVEAQGAKPPSSGLHPFQSLGFAQGKSSTPPTLHPTMNHDQLAIHHSPSPILYSSNPPTLQPSKFPFSNLQSLTATLFLFALLLNFFFFYGLNETGWSPNSPFYNLLAASTLLSLVSALAWLLWKFAPRLHPHLLTALTATLISFDLFSVNWTTNLYPQLPEWHTQRPDVVQAIAADAAQSPGELYRIYNEFRLFDNYGVAYGLEDLWGASPLRPARYDQFLAPPLPIERAWELLNVRYVITWRQDLYLPSTIIYQEPAADGTTYVHRLDTTGPRAWLVTRTEIADDDTIVHRLADPNFDRWHIALLEAGDQSSVLKDQLSTINPLPPSGSAQDKSSTPPIRPSAHPPSSTLSPLGIRSGQTFHSTNPQSLSLSVTTPTPALLILSEPYYPGWQATVDGTPAPILRAYTILRAIPVPAGEHQVALVFRPWSFTAGVVVSAISLVAVIMALAFRLQPGGLR